MPAEGAHRHARPRTARGWRAAAWLTALAVMGVTGTAAAMWRHTPARGGLPVPAAARIAATRWPLTATAAPQLSATTAGKPLLTPRARRSCPAAASACVDLADHVTWLQADGRVTYGPVRMEPGPPGTAHATPRGTFYVHWKAGATYVSTIYGEPMPWAVFFAPGGVAFHGGSLTKPSHGCVHLDIGSARYYHDHLPAGAEVVVF